MRQPGTQLFLGDEGVARVISCTRAAQLVDPALLDAQPQICLQALCATSVGIPAAPLHQETARGRDILQADAALERRHGRPQGNPRQRGRERLSQGLVPRALVDDLPPTPPSSWCGDLRAVPGAADDAGGIDRLRDGVRQALLDKLRGAAPHDARIRTTPPQHAQVVRQDAGLAQRLAPTRRRPADDLQGRHHPGGRLRTAACAEAAGVAGAHGALHATAVGR
mmetsp:Transcript_42666/g.123319  ORF Transcript_42666/g.123319 Transcript_42666/m.123319 type:complete len:223 (-) Transcript_42666:28-696(-)